MSALEQVKDLIPRSERSERLDGFQLSERLILESTFYGNRVQAHASSDSEVVSLPVAEDDIRQIRQSIAAC